MATFDCRFLKSLCTLFGMRIRVQQFCLNCLLMYMYVCVCYVVLYVKTCLGRVGCPPASRFDLDYVWNGSFPVP